MVVRRNHHAIDGRLWNVMVVAQTARAEYRRPVALWLTVDQQLHVFDDGRANALVEQQLPALGARHARLQVRPHLRTHLLSLDICGVAGYAQCEQAYKRRYDRGNAVPIAP